MPKITFDKAEFRDGGLWLGVTNKPQAKAFVMQMPQGHPHEADIDPKKNKRSLDANAYLWVLVGRMADVLRVPKNAVYINMLEQYGQRDYLSLRAGVAPQHYFKYYETLGKRTVDGETYTDYMVFRGSSLYDTREMSVLIDGVVSECKELDIETATPEELARMKEEWRGQKHNSAE